MSTDSDSEIEKLEQEHTYCRKLANFHQKMVCDDFFAKDRDFHLLKMKKYDDLCEELGKKIGQLYQENKQKDAKQKSNVDNGKKD
ncbi:hypothetical protein EZS27_000344 [termite gut metagenome]|uniref:Uncharacterized protein n=1 Tax=termite gut metagenome TaxID=433724 RepID=A0A5J4T1Y8_9ZZZZ